MTTLFHTLTRLEYVQREPVYLQYEKISICGSMKILRKYIKKQKTKKQDGQLTVWHVTIWNINTESICWCMAFYISLKWNLWIWCGMMCLNLNAHISFNVIPLIWLKSCSRNEAKCCAIGFLFILLKKIGYEVCDFLLNCLKQNWPVFNKQKIFRGDLSYREP